MYRWHGSHLQLAGLGRGLITVGGIANPRRHAEAITLAAIEPGNLSEDYDTAGS